MKESRNKNNGIREEMERKKEKEGMQQSIGKGLRMEELAGRRKRGRRE